MIGNWICYLLDGEFSKLFRSIGCFFGGMLLGFILLICAMGLMASI